ncbi:MAG: hypothetical protein HY898_35305 [Deltaproteobacteria bacterium]|nr:hypothetical protein [Deltaproteobacteria bacterium]
MYTREPGSGRLQGERAPGRTAFAAVVTLAVASVIACSKGDDAVTGHGGWQDPDASTAGDAAGSAGFAGDSASAGSAGSADAAVCVPKTCTALGATCGSAPDGCNGEVTCGGCPTGQHCGGGGPNKCGTNPCSPKTCAQLGASCGWLSDGCSVALDCGACVSPAVCGGAGKPNQCGCAPKSCAQLGASCGSVPDGCAGKVDCGTCPAGQTCGGNGTPNQCGSGSCTAKTCAQVGASCGFASDGCSQALDCGKCVSPATCGGDGKPGQCGCSPKTCAMIGVSCGVVDNGCGQTMDCGSCGQGETCGGSGQPGLCGCACTLPHAAASCAAGVCSLQGCDADWADCDADVDNGCEVHVADDPDHCSGCNKKCTYAHAGALCGQGTCAMGTCDQGWTDCDKTAVTGCEINTDADPANCGSCGESCSSTGGTPKCWGGVCGIDCAAGLGDCNANVADGCETNLKTSLHHCGSCTKDCANPLPTGVATAKCTAGACAVSTCASGRFDQNTTFKDGCECLAEAHPNSCASALAILPNPIAVGAMAQVTGNLIPTGDQDWFVASFSGASSCSFHPRVQLTDSSGTGLLRLVVQSSCGTHLACSEGGTSTSATTWEFTYSKTCGTAKPIDPSKKASTPTTVRVGVFATGTSTTCLPYTLKFSN